MDSFPTGRLRLHTNLKAQSLYRSKVIWPAISFKLSSSLIIYFLLVDDRWSHQPKSANNQLMEMYMLLWWGDLAKYQNGGLGKTGAGIHSPCAPPHPACIMTTSANLFTSTPPTPTVQKQIPSITSWTFSKSGWREYVAFFCIVCTHDASLSQRKFRLW